MSNNINDLNHTPKNKVFAGVILLAVGAVLLIKQLNFFFFPNWLISWPMLLIVWGLYTGAKNNYRKPLWFILVIAGVGFLLDDIFPSFDMGAVVWPVLLISFGLWIIMKRNRADNAVHDTDYWDKKYKASPYTDDKPLADFSSPDFTTGTGIIAKKLLSAAVTVVTAPHQSAFTVTTFPGADLPQTLNAWFCCTTI